MKRTDSRRRPANRQQRKARAHIRKEREWANTWSRQQIDEHIRGRIVFSTILANYPELAERIRQLYEMDAENHRKEVMNGACL